VSLIEALVLGVAQGLTEFIPVSSSAHLVLVPALLRWPEPSLSFVVAAHLGTLVAVVIYYWRDWVRIVGDVARWLGRMGREPATDGARTAGLLLVATVPAALVGMTLEKPVELLFNDVALVGGALFVTAALLMIAERVRAGQHEEGSTTWWQALVIGAGQAVAVVPGISRSGATICTGLLVGLKADWAPRFAFLMSVPILAGAGAKKALDLARSGGLGQEGPALAVGFLTSCVFGLLAIHVVLRAVRVRRLRWFGAYCLAVGALTLAGHFSGLIS
jgi:undecaprenyl-diphosphatase